MPAGQPGPRGGQSMPERRLAAVLIADMAGYSRLMEADEEEVIGRQRRHRAELIDPAIAANHGHIVKTTGDGMLATFDVAGDAVRCALDIQQAMAVREADTPEDRRIRYRVGIGAGDVTFEDGDIFGDVVNVAARLEALAEPGGVCITDTVHQMVQTRIEEAFSDLGSQMVRHISRPIRVWQWSPEIRERHEDDSGLSRTQQIGFCTAPDGVQLAHATIGSGPTVLKMPNWFNHLDYDWMSPIWGPWLRDIARNHRLVRFDQRGNGLSDWDVPEISEDAMQRDVETVVAACGLDRFAILGFSQGGAIGIRYAFAHPERVTCLVIVGGYVRGLLKRNDPQAEALHDVTVTAIRAGWGSPDPAYRHLFTELFIPDAGVAQKSNFDELQRVATSADNALKIADMNAHCDVTDMARQLRVPTLVMHAEGDRRIPLEEGRRFAAAIPGARFLPLPGNNHILAPGSPAYGQFLRALREFVAAHAD